jgi:Arc/MetJ-type ribon-helix-helix transcriptional regulator
MTIHLPDDLARDVEAEVSSGHFASIDEAMTEAARLLLRQLRQGQGGDKMPEALPSDLTDEERADQEAQRRLFDAGLLSEIKPPIRDLSPYRNRQAIPIEGEPLSETIIRERR